MMVKWKNEAIEAADAAYHAKMSIEDSFEFWRIVLDAAVKAQGLDDEMRESALQYIATAGQAQENYARGRAEGFEEAAKVAESDMLPFSLGGDHILDRATGMTIADAIRALAKGAAE